MEQFLTLKDVSAYLNVKDARVRDLIRRGDLKVYRVGRLLRFKPRDLETFVARCASERQ